MTVAYRGPNWAIRIHGKEHGIPHFHLDGPGFRCSVEIASLELIVGTALSRVMKDALAWARLNQDLLFQIW